MLQQEKKEIQNTRYISTHLALTTTTQKERENVTKLRATEVLLYLTRRTTLSSTKVASI